LFLNATKDDTLVYQRVIAFEEKLIRDLERIGGEQYATLAALAYRFVVVFRHNTFHYFHLHTYMHTL
jgi:hypothetical protein